MGFVRPTLSKLQERDAADVASRLDLSALLPKSVLRALAYTLAANAHELHGGLVEISLGKFPQTAGEEDLLHWADLRGVVRKPATFASGLALFQGQVGLSVPIDSQLSRIDGTKYQTSAAGTIGAGGSVAIAVQALDAGEIGNCAAGQELKFSSPILGIQSTAVVDASGIGGGVDLEPLEELRARIIERWRNPPRGGAAGDWIEWALEVPGVTRAWVYPNRMGPGTVGVSFVVDDASYGPIPQAADLDAVRDHLELTRPITAQLYVFPPVAVPVDFQVTINPDTPELRAEVENALRDVLLREAEPGGTVLLSHLREAVSLAVNEGDSDVSQPSGDIVSILGEMSTFGTLAFL